METARAVLIGVHVLCWGSLLLAVAVAVTTGTRRAITVLPIAAVLAALTGVGLIGARAVLDLDVIVPKMAVKVVLVATVIVLSRQALARHDRPTGGSRPLVAAAGLAAVGDLVVALAWT